MPIYFVSRRLKITTSIPIAIGTGDFAERETLRSWTF